MTRVVPPFQRYIQMWCISNSFLVIYKNVLNFRSPKVLYSQINAFKTMFQLMKVILIKLCHNIEDFLWFKVNCIPITAYSQQLSSHNQTILKHLICHQIIHIGKLHLFFLNNGRVNILFQVQNLHEHIKQIYITNNLNILYFLLKQFI